MGSEPQARTQWEGSVLEAQPHFQRLEGATLQLWAFTFSHGIHTFLASHSTGKVWVQFSHVEDVDCWLTMHSTRIRMATEAENELFSHTVSERQKRYLDPLWDEMGMSPRVSRVMIECCEGICSIWGFHVRLVWGGEFPEPRSGFIPAEQSVWEGSPPLRDL
ncbi:MAG: hypothetical protein FJX77_17315 [Armatimonadetes bacterium]|nr:hypothetical protein [Armatimonadota bacterium]